MLNIAIIDDQKDILLLLDEYTSYYLSSINEAYQIYTYCSIDSFLKTNLENIDIVLLDIEMPEMNGINVALKIREHNKKSCICFITGYDQYISESYRIHAFDYILKPITKERIQKLISEILEYMSFNKANETKLSFDTTIGKINISASEILYFEYIGASKSQLNRSTKLVTSNNTFLIKGSITSLFSFINDQRFAIPHQSFIVNFENIRTLKRVEIIMTNGDCIPISQKKCKEMKTLFNEYINVCLGTSYD